MICNCVSTIFSLMWKLKRGLFYQCMLSWGHWICLNLEEKLLHLVQHFDLIFLPSLLHPSCYLNCYITTMTFASMLSHFSCVLLSVTLGTVACQAPLPMGFSRQEYWSGLPFPSPGYLPYSGMEPGLLDFRQILYHLSYEGSPIKALLLCYFRWKLRHSPLFHILSNSQAPHAAFPSSTPFMCPHTRMGRALLQGVLCCINSTAALLR